MNTLGNFDLNTYHYVLDEKAILQPQNKVQDGIQFKYGKTDATIHSLFAELKKTTFDDIEKTHTLFVFTKQLTNHVESSIKKRYRFLSWLIIFFSKNVSCGTLSKLQILERTFSTHVAQQKEILIQQLAQALEKDKPNLLGKLFFADHESRSGCQKTDERYNQLKNQPLFSPKEAIQLAWHIEQIRPLSQSPLHIKKDPANGLPRSLHIDSMNDRIFISQKGNKQSPIAKTKIKKITKALLVGPVLHAPTVVAQLTTQDLVSDHVRQVTLAEYKIAKELKGNSGIWDVIHCTEYTKHKDDKSIPKVALFTSLGAGTFFDIGREFQFHDLVQTTYTLLEGLELIHKNGYVHADIKGANALIEPKDNAPHIAGWIDFGRAGKTHDELIRKHFKEGFYGTLKYTAPELFGVQGFCDDFTKTDMWAFGLTLFYVYFQKYPDWVKLIPDKKEVISYKTKADYKKAIDTELNPARNTLLQKKALSQQDRFEMLIYKLLVSDPKVRLSATQALHEFNEIM